MSKETEKNAKRLNYSHGQTNAHYIQSPLNGAYIYNLRRCVSKITCQQRHNVCEESKRPQYDRLLRRHRIYYNYNGFGQGMSEKGGREGSRSKKTSSMKRGKIYVAKSKWFGLAETTPTLLELCDGDGDGNNDRNGGDVCRTHSVFCSIWKRMGLFEFYAEFHSKIKEKWIKPCVQLNHSSELLNSIIIMFQNRHFNQI